MTGIPAQLLLPAPVPASCWSRQGGEVAWASDPLQGCSRVLVVSAHPDDETVGAGRMLADFAGRIDALTLTAGERCVAHPSLPVGSLGARRLTEWRAALDELGATPLETERWPDGDLGAAEEEIEESLEALIGSTSYDALVVTWEHDPHPDHAAAGRAAARVGTRSGVRVLHIPVWAPYWMTPEQVGRTGASLRHVPTSAAAEAARERALSHYRSQLDPLEPGWPPVVPPDVLARHPHQWLVVTS